MKKGIKSKMKRTLALVSASILVFSGMDMSGFTKAEAAESTFADTIQLGMSFEDDLSDVTGNYTPTSVGTAEYIDGVNGGKAINFTGSNYLELGTGTSIQSEDMTLSFWLKAPDTGLSGEQMITWFKPDGTWYGDGWYMSTASDTVPLEISLGASYADFGQPYKVQITGNRSEFFPAGEWVNVVVTYESSTNTFNVYRNGVLQTSKNIAETGGTGVIGTTAGNKWIGGNSPAYGGKSILAIDEFEYFSGIATQDDVNILFTKNGGVVVDTPDTGDTDTTDEDSQLLELSDFELGEVLMEDEYYVNSFEKEVDYLLSFDTDKLLAGFRETAGLSMNGATRYSGWENTLIGGHTIGHYLSACAQAYANAEISSEDKTAIYEKITTIIDGLKECQDNTKGETGFIFGATLVSTTNVEAQFDNVELNRTNISTQSWVPWYTMHKILAGIVDVYKQTGYENALTVADALGTWTYNRVGSWSTATQNIVLGIEYGGMNDSLYELYKITGDENQLIAAHKFDEVTLFNNVLSGASNVLNNRHANTTIPKFIGALNRYRALKDAGLLTEADEVYLEYAEAFWDMVNERHSYITGGNSEWEHFGADYVLDTERTACNCETCNTYNMLKLSRELFKLTGDKKYSDYYENTLINAIMSSQNPETGMSMYFQPMATGYFKVFGTQFTNFWCCTGSGMENFTKLNDSIYFKMDKTAVVNLYLSSTLNWADEGITLKQVSDFPDSDTAVFTLNTSAQWDGTLMFRIPDWAVSSTVTVNGTEVTYSTINGYAVIEGPFNDGDVIELTFPMEVVAYSLPDNTNAYSFKYGPVLLSADLGSDSMTQTTTGVNVSIPASRVTDYDYVTVDYSIGSVADYIDNINDYLVKDEGTMSFTLTGTDTELTYTPHYSKYDVRYGIYINFLSDDAGMESAVILDGKESARAEAALLDTVQPGYGQYENDALHDMTESDSVGVTNDGTYRYALAGGYFTYDMKVDSSDDNVLECIFRKADNGKTIKISIGNTVIYNETLNYDGTEDEYTVNVPISKAVLVSEAAIKNVDLEDVLVATFKFESGDANESAKLSSFVKTRLAYGTDAEITDVTSENSTVSMNEKVISVTVDKGESAAELNFELLEEYGYLVVDGNVVDDTKTVSIALDGKEKSVEAIVYAEDHMTSETYTINISQESDLVYFVDCGDYDVTTVSDGDQFGTHNSVTDKIFGVDSVTGYEWGIIDNTENRYNGTLGVCTYNTWAYEFNNNDNIDKMVSNRYTKNQYENGYPTRYIDYGFELENGKYEVEVGFADPWGVSNNPAVYADFGTDSERVISSDVDIASNPIATGTIEVTDGELTLNMRSVLSSTLAVNVSYIKITAVSDGEVIPETPTTEDETDTEGETETTTSGKKYSDPVKADGNKVVSKEDAKTTVTDKLDEVSNELVEVISNGSIELTSDIFKAIKENGNDFIYNVTDENDNVIYSWTFGSDTMGDKEIDVDLGMSFETELDDEIISKSGVEDPLFINFNFHGELPGPATIKVYVGDKYADEDTVYLYYYDEENDEVLKVGNKALTVKEGYVEFTINHCSVYFVAEDDLNVDVDENSLDDASVNVTDLTADDYADGLSKTGDSNMTIWLGFITLLMGAAVFGLRSKKFRTEK